MSIDHVDSSHDPDRRPSKVEPEYQPGSRIWLFAALYFACYIPYASLPKYLTQRGVNEVKGISLLPISATAAVLSTLFFFSAVGWWRHANQRRIWKLSIPIPTRWTFLAGVTLAGIVAMTPLLYTSKGMSPALMGLLSRGGVLLLGPLIDTLTKQNKERYWYVGWALALLAVWVATDSLTFDLPRQAFVVVSLYLVFYFVRFNIIGSRVKAKTWSAKRRYWVEEQMIAAPIFLLTCALLAFIGWGEVGSQLRIGFGRLAHPSEPVVLYSLIIGMLGFSTGLCATFIFTSDESFSFCVPLNRAAGVFAQISATVLLSVFVGIGKLKTAEVLGAVILAFALGFMAIINRRKTVVPVVPPSCLGSTLINSTYNKPRSALAGSAIVLPSASAPPDTNKKNSMAA